MSEYICPHCHNPIYDEDALSCHFCGESLNRAGNGFLSNMRYSQKYVMWVLLGFILIAFVFFMM